MREAIAIATAPTHAPAVRTRGTAEAGVAHSDVCASRWVLSRNP
jgi:hypothetical protein